jgi:uncharacterized protein YuzE
MKARATFDPEADAIGIYFAPEGATYDASEEVAPGLTLDFDEKGNVIGVEIAGVRAFLANRAIPAKSVPAKARSAAE